MEVLFVLVALGGGAYWFFRGNTRRGGETVRAHVFLSALQHGRTVEDANKFASLDLIDLAITFAGTAKANVKINYGGKSLAMVAEAYRSGMYSRLNVLEKACLMLKYDVLPTVQNSSKSSGNLSVSPRPAASRPASEFSDFNSYFAAYIAELRRLAGTKSGRFHPAELMVQDGARLAYRDRVPPQTLAAMIHDDEIHRQRG